MVFRRFFAICFIQFLCQVFAFPEITRHNSPSLKGKLTALRRSDNEPHAYSREIYCPVDMIGIQGEYYYTSQGTEDKICNVYLLAEPDEVVEIEFKDANFQCDETNQLLWFDGWSMGIGSFPSMNDHPLNMTERSQMICPEGDTPLTFRAHQNAAMMSFILPSRGAGFTIILKPRKTSEPCNVMAPNPSGMHTITNYGGSRNCSLSVIYPTRIRVVEMMVGQNEAEATLRCKNVEDYVEFLAGNGLDVLDMRQDAVLCGSAGLINPASRISSRSGAVPTVVPASLQSASLSDLRTCTHGMNINLNCQNSVVRLVSGGEQNNFITVEFMKSYSSKNDCEFPDY
ncbi:Corticotropin-releasing factor-binding protein [Holothuria leucospilota]|uniref:Corticotropin-releasing factor-binding protein n=1 Tax=Holothuria leucospilota TaxID=206669 RepID=A0A9Q1BZR4_HOLLE|nr:Corticotropin-releasing factor-binding protein [Holothuria leucospilota]